ncbi:hypothetical protein QM467_06700 [Rhodoblastus sp. 17X3]|uniref:hypothetical protein n=1 Tax=Rhodoblastus sp. 17X3 TaxID=3047026 RepID=UPI0024B7523C|nr:hypothetical protein [Rhodoblastus sp. 17X3]MDI9847741.1 hypothetical protein [Rhodoblastus sp. 17X3]
MAEPFALAVHPKMTELLSSLVEMLVGGLREIGFAPVVTHALPSDFLGRIIVLGANFYGNADLDQLPPSTIIFNLENSNSIFLTDVYRNNLRKFTVWDYSKSNADDLARLLGRPVFYLKTFYVEGLSRIADDAEIDIDVLFFGSFNDRRQKIIDALRERGFRVEAVFGVFGQPLDQLIARSKVVLNVHYYDNGRLEMIRLFDLLANGRAVVTELNPGELIDADLADGLVTAPYESLADAVESLVVDKERRCERAMDGLRAFRGRRAGTILREALAWADMPRLPSAAIIGSGKAFDPDKLNIDIHERWNPDIVADIADAELFTREFKSRRFGLVRLQKGCFDRIGASHVLEHVPDLVTAMTNCLDLLGEGGVFDIAVPYDLSYGAWQDPTHVHAFNERSWLYYCDWYWYLGWTEARFDLIDLSFQNSPIGDALAAKGMPADEILRTPRAVDEMRAVLRKRALTEQELALGREMRGEDRSERLAGPNG